MVSMDRETGIFYCTLIAQEEEHAGGGGYNTAMAKPILYWKPT
jgi:hypothetical protein